VKPWRLAAAMLLLSGAASALAAPPPDTIAQRVLACAACHGKEGRATSEGYYPRIAGKPAGYLYQQLLHFRDGRRRNASMVALIDTLPEPYLREIAEHFAAQHLPYPAPAPVNASAAELARGRVLVQEGDSARGVPACASCHGKSLTGVAPAVPGLLGLPRDYLNAQLGAWQGGTRRATAPDCMADIARRLRSSDIAAATAWLASQAVPADARAPESAPTAAMRECGSVTKDAR
jgi:cytochrome c553